jgi:TorA maturation chaperone TorD
MGLRPYKKIYTQKEVNIMKIGYQTDLEEQRILGLIDDDTYYMLKRHEAALTYDVEEQQRLMRLQLLEKRQKQKREAEERQKKKQEQEKAIKQAIEKDLPAKIEKTLEKEFQKIFSKR